MFGSSVLDVQTPSGWFELKYVEFSLEAKGWQWSPETVWGETWSFLRAQLQWASWSEHWEIQELFSKLTDQRVVLDGTTRGLPVMQMVLDEFERALRMGRLRFEATFTPGPPIEEEWEIPAVNMNPDKRPPPLTPSELWGRKPATEEKTFIGLRVFDQNEKAVKKTPLRVTLPNGRVINGATDEQGELFIDGFVGDGNAKVSLLNFCVPGKSEAPEWPEEYEYSVKVTDESSNSVPNVWVKFTEGKQYQLALVDGNGVATYKTKAAEGVGVTFHDVSELGTAMAPVWSASQAVAPEQWVKPVAEQITVLSMRGGTLQEQVADDADTEASDTEASDTKASDTKAFKPFEQIALKAGQEHQISVQPHVTLVRLVGMGFDTEKSFLLPTALPTMRRIKELFEEHRQEILVIAGHADSAGGAAHNDALSLERALATLSFLTDDVDAWLDWYKSAVPESKRWGAAEDRQMLRGLVARSKLDSSVPKLEKPEPKGYQVWHNQLPAANRARNWEPLQEDGKLGDATREQLIGDYMNLDGTTLPSKALAATYGCGESFPLPEPKEGSAWERFSEQRNRRVEFLFFDRLLGISPPLEKTQIAAPGSTVYPAWLAKAEIEDLTTEAGLKEVTFVEMHDALFRTNSAVILPEGEDPSSKQGGGRALTSVGLFATVLRYNDLYRGKKLFIAGHTDTKGSDQFNQPLSEERAKVALALLLGQRDEFIKLCDKRHDEVDVTQIFEWATNAFGFACKPTTLTAAPSEERYHQFRTSFNAWVEARDPVAEADERSSATKLADRGRLDNSIWGAIFDLYEYDLRQELDETEAGVEALRGKLVWVDDNRRTMGFGERFPVDNLARNDFRSQSNRRVEVLMFDPGEEPDLAATESDPETADLYLPGLYGKLPVAMSSAGLEYAWVESDSLLDIHESPPVTNPIFNDSIAEDESEHFQLLCESIHRGEVLEQRHGALHGNISPALSWSGQPAEVKEFVIVICDVDAQDYLHWIVRDIPSTVSALPEAVRLPLAATTQGASPLGAATLPYRGPQPPASEAHRYILRLYGLANPLQGAAIPQEFSQLDALLKSHGATIAEVFALYSEP